MTQEEKILLKDICSRALYRPKGVFLHKAYDPEEIEVIGYNGNWVEVYRNGDFDEVPIESVRLYLRPMSSMTLEEFAEYIETFKWDYGVEGTPFDWLNERHFDYRGLIEKGLAISVTEKNNPYK